MIGYIYLITDTTNGMKYTGKHHYHIEGQLDPNYHGSGTIIKNIYKKRPETLKEEYIKTCYSEEEMNSDEQYYIKLFKTLWPNGYNLTEGGDGLIPCEETRKKLSESLKGKTLSEEARKKISESLKGKPKSEEHKKKLSESIKGKTLSEEVRKKISESLKGKQFSEETRRKLSDANKGKTLSEEARKKISEARKGKSAPNKGKPMSEEARKKMSDAKKGKPSPNKGKPMSEEQKKKLSKKVLQFTLNGEFIREWPSFAECERNGFYGTAVCKCCQGKQKTHKGFVWKYKD